MLSRIATCRGLPHASKPTRIYGTLSLGGVRYLQTAKPADLPVSNKKKIWDSVDEAVKDVKSGDVLLCGGECASGCIVRDL